MTIVLLMLAVVALGVVLAVVISRVPVPGVEDPVSTQAYPGLPLGPVRPEQVRDVTVDVAFRGYRMDQVDAIFTRLADELVVRDDEIDRLRKQENHGDL